MKKKKLISLSALGMIAALSASAQVKVDYDKYPDYSPIIKPDYSLAAPAQSLMKSRAVTVARPSYVNNAENIYFPPVFNQDGGSCGSASRIGYMFTYEMNALRGADASKEANQYPTHFTWLLTNSNSGKEGMAVANGIPNRPTYGGRTYSAYFGDQIETQDNYGWMQGYWRWYQAMNNRITKNANFPNNVNTEEGREAVKNWIWNHNGDTDFKAGGICGIGVASAATQGSIPSTPANAEAGVVGMKYVTTWGSSVDHALTIVGYDDRIEFDLNNNGVYGETSNDEVGAWIIVNSWGNTWANKGFIYCPYKYGCPVGTSGNYWTPETYYARKNYTPLRTIKVKMDYSKRSELCLSAGVSSDINATEPEQTTLFEHFKYAGDGANDGVDAETPMLGKWADGMHYEPMEFGYDLTDLSASFDRRKALKYFFIIESKSTANGVGKIYNASIIDYEFDSEGVELPYDISSNGVEVKTAGNKTIISMVVSGEPFYAPRNLAMSSDFILSWTAPEQPVYSVKSYNIYKGGELFTNVEASKKNYDASADTASIYSVSALYSNNGNTIESAKTNAVSGSKEDISVRNRTRNLTNSGFTIPDVFSTKYSSATIEFWLNPSNCANWNQQIGAGWGKFLFHTTSNAQIVAGWDTSNRFTSENNALKVGTWNHVAIVIKGSELTVLVNGKQIGSIKSSSYSGIGSFSDFTVGWGSSISGTIDEVRIWKTARTEKEINSYMYSEIGAPTTTEGLIAYYKMDHITESGTVKLRDAASSHNAPYLTSGSQSIYYDNTLLKESNTAYAGFYMPEAPYYANEEIQLTSQSAPNTQTWNWNIPEAGITNLNVQNPIVMFTKSGDFSVKLTTTNVSGETADTTATIHIDAQTLPTALFTSSLISVPAGERISFMNKTTSIGTTTYEWSMPGAEKASANTTNAATAYAKAGTYTVTLKAKNASGVNTYSKNIEVYRAAPISDFTIHPSTVLKGDSVFFDDLSTCEPTSWTWLLTSKKHSIGINGQNTCFAPSTPGIYSASLTASNDLGKNTATQERALIVCNADGKNGLKFSGSGEKVSFTGPFASASTSKFTIDYWLYPTNLSNECNQMGDSENTILMKTNSQGQTTVSVGGKSVTSATGYVIPSQWHHYAITFNTGIFSFYRDGELINTSSVSGLVCPAWSNGFSIGGSGAPMNAVIDEFRIWSTALSARYIRQYNNEPIAESNLTTAMSSRGLQLYYQFNQSSGSVTDATTNGYTGARSGFGPEGDAWSSSLGIFCLNNESSSSSNVTEDYLTNYKAPFLNTGEAMSNMSSKLLKLETGTATSGWILENKEISDNGTSEFLVYKDKESSMCCMPGYAGLASSLTDHKAYQTITLPAGVYNMAITAYDDFSADSSYIVLSKAGEFPKTSELATSIAHASMKDMSLTFVLTEETNVSLGMLINTMGNRKYITVKEITLTALDAEVYNANNITGINDVISGNKGSNISLSVSSHILTITSSESVPVKIHNADGKLMRSTTVNGTFSVALPSGAYIVNGKTVIIN